MLIVLCAAAAALLAWEGYALATGEAALITTVVAEANAYTGGLVGLLFGFITGLLAGHFFWPRQRRDWR